MKKFLKWFFIIGSCTVVGIYIFTSFYDMYWNDIIDYRVLNGSSKSNSRDVSDYYVGEVSDYMDEQYNNDKLLNIKLDIENADVVFNPVDLDEGAIQISGHGFDKKFSVFYDKEKYCISIKNKYEFTEKSEIEFNMPMYFNNNVSFDINSKNSSLIFNKSRNNHGINVKSISCNVINGKIIGENLKADDVNFQIDDLNNVLIQNILSENKKISQFKT